MTLGIAASGRRAGAAVLAAIRTAELLGRGEIGGFAVLAALTNDGRLCYAETQRGGSEGIASATAPTTLDEIASASVVAAITSGPDRPEPLTRFLPGQAGIGLVTGHRLPDTPGADGEPLNRAVLARMATGAPPAEAIEAILRREPEADAGFVAITANGRIAAGNTARVERRPDRGSFAREGDGWSVALLHNAIAAHLPLAEAIGAVAGGMLSGMAGPIRLLSLAPPIPIVAAARDRVIVDRNERVLVVETANPALPTARRRGSAIYLASEVVSEERVIGHTISETLVEMAEGAIVALAGGRPPFLVLRARDG